ncbi:MAG: TetR/AcrR family transcriptional regulator [Duganella sp.]
MSSTIDDKLASALAIAIAQQPRANLQQIAKRAGISKATLYRIAPTREGLIDLLMERAADHLQEALVKADLAEPPFDAALSRLTTNVIRGGAFYLFWHAAQWVRMLDMPDDADESLMPSFYGEALEEFFLRGQRAGVFRIDMPAKWLVKSYDYLLYAAVESAHSGAIATLGMAAMVEKTFLSGVQETPPNTSGKSKTSVKIRSGTWTKKTGRRG